MSDRPPDDGARAPRPDALHVAAEAVITLASVITALFFILIVAQVVARYLLQASITWSEEAARYAFAWSTLLAAAGLTATGGHYSVRMLDPLFRARGLRVLEVARALVELGFVAVVAWYGFRWSLRLVGVGTPVMQLDQGFVYLVVPLCATFMAIAIVVSLVRRDARN
jgi:TRAP-type C4-dicarboxylate transport system permease small subunit